MFNRCCQLEYIFHDTQKPEKFSLHNSLQKKEKKRGLINENDLIKRLYKHALKKCIFKNATLREESKCILNLTKIDDQINNLLEQFGRHILQLGKMVIKLWGKRRADEKSKYSIQTRHLIDVMFGIIIFSKQDNKNFITTAIMLLC